MNFTVWTYGAFSQGSLSRAFGLRPRSEKASPSSSSDTGSLASQCQYMSSSVRSTSPPPPQLPPRPMTTGGGGGKRHRRVKSIGDIEYISTAAVSTPVWQEGRPHYAGPYRSLSERGYSSSSSQYSGSYSGYSNVLTGGEQQPYQQYQQQSGGNYYHQLQGGYYSPQSSGPPFPGVQRYGSLAEEAWSSCSAKGDAGVSKANPRTYLA